MTWVLLAFSFLLRGAAPRLSSLADVIGLAGLGSYIAFRSTITRTRPASSEPWSSVPFATGAKVCVAAIRIRPEPFTPRARGSNPGAGAPHVAGVEPRSLPAALGVSRPTTKKMTAPTMAGTPMALCRTRLRPLTCSALTARR